MIHVAFNIDKNYTDKVQVVMNSILANTKSEVQFHVIGQEVENAKCYPKPDLTDLKYTNQMAHISMGATYRLYLPDILDIDKVIYLDCDLIVLDDIKELWQYDVKVIAGVQDPMYIKQARKNNLSHLYINSGVLVMNLDAMRKMNYKERIKATQTGEYNLSLLDQDIINIAYGEYIEHLPEKWNVYTKIYTQTTKEMIQARNKPSIIHWCGFEKPWNIPSLWNAKMWYDYKVQ